MPFRGTRRVEDGRGGLSRAAIAPFPIPAHRTGRADFRHPALRLVSPRGPRRRCWPCAVHARQARGTFAARHSSLGRFRPIAVLPGSTPITSASPSSRAHQKSGSFPPPALPGFFGTMALSDSRRSRRPKSASRSLPPPRRVSPVAPDHLPNVLCPIPRRIERVQVSISSPSARPSP